MNAPSLSLDLATALVVLPGPRCALADGSGARMVRPPEARDLFERGPVLLAHASLTARRLGLATPPRSRDLFDALELFVFVRPAKFCAPSAVGLAQALGLPEPQTTPDQAETLQTACRVLLNELADTPWPSREEAQAQPARPRVSARARASSRDGQGASASSASSTRQASCSASAWSATALGSGRPSAWASPTAEGAQNRAGRTKA